jgi:ABC-type multidrug transport system fused ATPase/permease subunit
MSQSSIERDPGHDGVRLIAWCLRPALPSFIAGVTMLLLATIATVSATLLFQPLFDWGVLGREGAILIPIVLVQMALLLTRGLLAGIAFDWLARASARLGHDLTLRIFDHLQRHSLSYFLDRSQADLLQLLRNDVLILETTLGQTVGQALIATLQTVIGLLVILVWEPRLAILCIVGLGAGAALIWLASRLTNRALQKEIAANASVAEHLLATVGLRGFFLRVGSSSAWERTRLRDLLERYRDALIGRRVPPSWVLVSGEGICTITYFGFYLAGAYLVAGGTATAGSLVALAAMVSYLIGSMNQLAPTYVALGDAWLRLRRIDQELAIEPASPEAADAVAPNALRGAFALDGVTVRYGDTIALHEVSLANRAGAITAIIGRSGAGKTTLTLLLLKLIEPDVGEVAVDGIRLRTCRRDALWRCVGYVPQEPVLFRSSARDNIAVGRPLAEADVVAAATAAGIHERLSGVPESYEFDVGENGYRLSAGERQRLALARALAGRPSVLVLDEPTASLDAATNAWIRKTIVAQRNAGRTVIVVTHNAATLAIADDVIVLDHGRLVCAGPMADRAVQASAMEVMQDHTA